MQFVGLSGMTDLSTVYDVLVVGGGNAALCAPQPLLSGILSLSRTNAFFLGGGKVLVNAYYLAAKQAGVAVISDSEMTAIEMDIPSTIHCVLRQRKRGAAMFD